MAQRSILRAVRAQHWANPAGGRLGSLLKPKEILLETPVCSLSCSVGLSPGQAAQWGWGML